MKVTIEKQKTVAFYLTGGSFVESQKAYVEAIKDVERINADEKYDQMYIMPKYNLTSIDIDDFLKLVNLSGQWIIYIYSTVITEDVFALLKTKIESLNGNNIVLKDSMVESFQFKNQDSKRIITIVEES